MLESTPQSEYINLGQQLWYLRKPMTYSVEEIQGNIGKFLDLLERNGFQHSRAAAEPLLVFSKQARKSMPRQVRISNSLVPQQTDELATIMNIINHAILNESGKRQMIVLKADAVSKRLRELPKVMTLTDTQTHLLDETIRCMECEAYRAAVVMGWNLAYDYVRRWVYNKKIDSFNNTLTKNHHKITNYEDFFLQDAPGERIVLDVCKKADIIDGKIYRSLCTYLHNRNCYAHSNLTKPSASKTNAYIECLLDIITAPPFNR